jgi:photosystem II stability/assembly factor-like uncharacterized protein
MVLVSVVLLPHGAACAAGAWVPRTSGADADLCGVSFPDGAHGWAVGHSGAILHTVDGGNTWAAQVSGVPAAILESVSFPDAVHGLAVGTDGTVISTSDGGAHWAVRPSGTTCDLNSVVLADDAVHGWAVGQAGTIIATSDGGAHWTPQSAGTDEWITAVAFPDASHGWAVGNWGIFLATSDGGAHWTEQTSGLDDITHCVFFGVAFADDNDGWAVGYRGHILATTDGGATWTTQNSGTTSGLFAIACTDAANAWAVGAGGRITATVDGGEHWKAQKSGQGNDLLGVCTDGSAALWSVGGAGTVLKSNPGAPETSMSGNTVGWSTTPEVISLTPSGTAPPFSTFYCLNDSPTATCTAPLVISGEGTTTIAYWSVDALGQIEATSGVTVKIDSVAPVSCLSGVTDKGICGGSARFGFSATDAASGVSAVYYSLDGAPPTAYSATVTVLPFGPHTVSWWAVDKAGNSESPRLMTFTVVPAQKTTLTVSASPTSVRLPKPFVLSGRLNGAPANGLPCVVMVKKPNKGYFSYSSARLTYGASGSASAWWYRYTPTMRGVYTFYVTFAGSGAYAAAPNSTTVKVTVR